jgi:hypothetical protein
MEAAAANLISKMTLRRAKDELGIKSKKQKSADGAWCWELPPKAARK